MPRALSRSTMVQAQIAGGDLRIHIGDHQAVNEVAFTVRLSRPRPPSGLLPHRR